MHLIYIVVFSRHGEIQACAAFESHRDAQAYAQGQQALYPELRFQVLLCPGVGEIKQEGA